MTMHDGAAWPSILLSDVEHGHLRKAEHESLGAVQKSMRHAHRLRCYTLPSHMEEEERH